MYPWCQLDLLAGLYKMISFSGNRTRASIGRVAELRTTEAASVIYLRLWSDGKDAQALIAREFNKELGIIDGNKAFRALETFWQLLTLHKLKPLAQYSLHCVYIGIDESCLANFINTAGDGNKADALLIARLLVSPHVAEFLTSCASEFGLVLKRMKHRTPEYLTLNLPEIITIH